MCDETLEERQDNELEALKSIFGDAVLDNREHIAWKVWRPLDLMLTLNPLHSSDIQGIHCSITLHIKCCANYPNKPPSISINKMHGISIDNSAKLLTELEKLAEEQVGEVMIFQLAQHVQQFLYMHNKPQLSFYDEMLQQKDEAEKLKLHDKQVKENEERQKIKDEIARRQEILRVASKQRVHRSSISQEHSNEGQGEGDAPKLVYYADEKMSPAKKVTRSRNVDVPCTCNAKGAHVVRITQRNNKKVYIGGCLGHSYNGCTTYLAIDDETGENLIAKKWTLPPAPDFQSRNKQLTAITQDLKAMYRLKHHSLIPYVAMESPKETVKRTSKQCIYIFREFVRGFSVKQFNSDFLSDRFVVMSFLRKIALGVLSALKGLHGMGVLHRDVRAENVFLDDSGKVKLVGASLDVRLTEILDGESYCDRQTEAHDIHATAHLLLSLISKDLTTHGVPSDLPSSAKDFFSRCLTEDEQSQWSAAQLVGHGFLVEAPVKEPGLCQKNEEGSGSEDDDAVKKIQISTLPANGHSRLGAEFEVLTWLGKGAFGDVLKVKNKLDGGLYAIKRIKLNPESVQLNKKITREVKLLSRLNHENVVRYYNAWIESITEIESEESTPVSKSPVRKIAAENSLEGIVAKLGQEVKVEWSISEGPKQKRNSESDSEESDDDEQDPWFNIMRPEDESSSGIEFECDSDNKSQTIPSEDIPESPRPPSERIHQVLYIQMEFCEKHTLRQAIDNKLYEENFRAWRLFREIVEGLAHVHQRGMIHRDLKPVNIFLDSNDHVKIGDFGLATKAFSGLPLEEKNKQNEDIGGSLTGQVGTALYVAPELLQAASKVIYNQKVDIYSLGIILFEMFHPPLSTGMERMMVLTELRSKDVHMPKDFMTPENAKQIHVIRWLLTHEASVRPTCAELLASEHVPRPVPEGALSGLLSHTLSERGSRGYQRLIEACLDQKVSTAEDYTYHNGMKAKPAELLTRVKDNVIRIFRSHCAVEFSPPFLTPRAKAWDQHPNAVRVVTASGSVCHLPHDLRLPFARHTAYSRTRYMRRYVVERVFREKHVLGFHPREMIECAFDIVMPKTDSLWPDAELLVVASRAAMENDVKVRIQLNHTELVRTLLLSCGVPKDKHHDIYPVLADVSLGRITSLQLQTHLTSLCVTNRDLSNLSRLLDCDVPVEEVRELVTQVVKTAKCSKIVNKAICEVETVVRTARALGCECQMTVAPFLAYNATQHSGVFWQLTASGLAAHCLAADSHPRHVKHRSGDVIAAGGRYDALVEEFWKVARAEKDLDNSELISTSVGFSMSLERIAAFVRKLELEQPVSKGIESGVVCVCVGGLGVGGGALAGVLRALWAGGARAGGAALAGDEARDLLRPDVVLQQDGAMLRAACWTNDRVREHKVQFTEVVDFIKQNLNVDSIRNSESTNNRSISWNDSEKSNSPTLSLTYITASERMTKNSKRLCENQINTQISSILLKLGMQSVLQKCKVHVLCLACSEAGVRELAANLSPPPVAVGKSVREVCTPLFKNQDILDEALQELSSIGKQNNQNKNPDEIHLYALYSIPDSLCRLIT